MICIYYAQLGLFDQTLKRSMDNPHLLELEYPQPFHIAWDDIDLNKLGIMDDVDHSDSVYFPSNWESLRTQLSAEFKQSLQNEIQDFIVHHCSTFENLSLQCVDILEIDNFDQISIDPPTFPSLYNVTVFQAISHDFLATDCNSIVSSEIGVNQDANNLNIYLSHIIENELVDLSSLQLISIPKLPKV